MANMLEDDEYDSEVISGSHGETFQKEVAIECFLRMREYSSPFRLAYEMKKADKFDDVVLIDDGNKEIHFIQVKHADAKDGLVKNIDFDALMPTVENGILRNSDFDLCKYITSYLKVIHNFEEYKYQMKFYILTNRNLPMINNEWMMTEEREVSKILLFPGSKESYLKLTPTKKAIKQLRDNINKDIIEVKEAIKALFVKGEVSPTLKNFSTPLKDVLTIDRFKKCSFTVGFNPKSKQFSVSKLYDLLKKDGFDIKKQVTAKANFLQSRSRLQFLPPCISEAELIGFFKESFTLSVGHPNDLRPGIDIELRTWMKTYIQPDTLGKLSSRDLDQIYTELKKQFEKLNKVTKKKRKVLKRSDLEKCLLMILNSYKIFENEEAKEFQKNYIKRQLRHKDGVRKVDGGGYVNFPLNNQKALDSSWVINTSFKNTVDRNISDNEFINELRGIFKDHQHIVIVAEPGMGKTSLLQFLAFEVQKQNYVEVFLVYFNTLVEELEKVKQITDLDDVLKILSSVLSKENCDVIENCPTQRDVEGYSIMLVMDGFDEIHSKYTNRIFEMLEQLKLKKSIRTIITSRMHVKELLENRFNVKSMVLEPFTKEDQIRYLKKMWNVPDDAERSLLSLLVKFHSSIPSNLRVTAGLPLMMRMLAEIYAEPFNKFIEASKTNQIHQSDCSEDNINIAKLFEQFVRKCFHMKLKGKYQLSGNLCDGESDSLIEGFILEHQLLAMKLLNIELFNNIIKHPGKMKKYAHFKNQCENEFEKSLLVKVVNNSVQFCHLSYSEYFVAKYLCDNIFSIEAQLFISILSKHKAIRKLAMVILGESVEFYDTLNDWCGTYWKIALWACESGCLGLVLCLEGHFKSFHKNNLNVMLRVCADNGFAEICELLLKNNSDPNDVDKNQCNALHWAAHNGHRNVAELLVVHNVDVNAMVKQQWTALHLAALNGHFSIVELLLNKQAIVHAENEDKWTALHLAAQNGHDQVIELFVQKAVDINSQSTDGTTPLHIAAQNGHLHVAELLIVGNADVNAVNDKKCTALHLAALNGHISIVQLLLQHQVSVNARNNDEWSALHLAAKSGHDNVIKLLIDGGADTNSRSINGRTPLHIAAWKGFTNVAELLIENKIEVNAEDIEQWTAMHLAALNGHVHVIKLLIDINAEANSRTIFGRSPLHIAAENGHECVAKLLILNHVKVNARDKYKWTAIHLAAQKGHVKVIQLLIENGGDINSRSICGRTPLHIAAENGHKNVVELLIANNVEVNAKDLEQWTAIHLAAANGHIAIVDLLLQNQANVNDQNKDKWSALHLAAESGHIDVVYLLLQYHANVNAQNVDKWTAIDMAIQNGHDQVIELLIKQSRMNFQ